MEEETPFRQERECGGDPEQIRTIEEDDPSVEDQECGIKRRG